jgi:hypothetical protein
MSLTLDNLFSEEKHDMSEQARLKVSVVQRAFVGREYLQIDQEGAHLNIVFENISDRDFKLWGRLKNDGYRNIRVLLTDEVGLVREARKAIVTGSEFGDGSEIFKPGERKIVEIYPASKEWEGFPTNLDKPKKYIIKIIYESTMPVDDPLSWIGKVESTEYTIWLFSNDHKK